jgi:hypothetical protein
VLVVAHLAAACLYAGFQLTVRLVVYPQMSGVPAEASAAYERAHQRRITPLVGVLFGTLGLTVLLLQLDGDLPRGLTAPAAALYAVLLAVTAFGAVPQHAALSRGFAADAHARLLRWDSLRTAVALLQAGLAVALALGS